MKSAFKNNTVKREVVINISNAGMKTWQTESKHPLQTLAKQSSGSLQTSDRLTALLHPVNPSVLYTLVNNIFKSLHQGSVDIR